MIKKKTTRPETSAETGDGENRCRKPSIRMLEVSDLRPHPRQTELVGDMAPAEFKLFADDIGANGIRDPLIVMADRKSLICGHQRTRAARQHKIALVPCIIREDLHNPDDPAVIELLLGDNLHRRQLSKLQQAKSAIKLAEIECDRENLIFDWQRIPRIVKSVASRLGDGDKNARRYVLVSKTPLPIQQAFERKLLTLVAAAQIANLGQDPQEKLAALIAKLLAKIDSNSDRAIKKKINDLVQAAFQKTSRQKRSAASSPVHTLCELKASLNDFLPKLKQNKGAIIAHLRGDDLDVELRAIPEFSTVSSFQSRIVHEVQEASNALLGELVDISDALGREAKATGPRGASEADASLDDDRTDTVSPSNDE